MDLLRRHLFFIICGVAALAGIALGVTGLRAMPKVVARMEEARTLYEQLGALRPVNERSIEAQRQRIEAIVEDYQAVLARAKELYGYEPLVRDVFPAGSFEALREFRLKYRQTMKTLLETVNAGQPAGIRDIQDMRDVITQEELERQLAPRQEAGATSAPEPPFTPAGVLTTSGARADPAARAQLAAARRIYCYANPPLDRASQDYVPSLDFHAAFYEAEVERIPTLEEAWWAQVGLWIQQDILRAIASLNQEAAERLEAANETPWVGNLPVKDIISLRVSLGFITAEDDAAAGYEAGGYKEALPPTSGKLVFTHSETEPALLYVVQFTAHLIMDQRDLLRLVAKLSADRFHTVLRVAYVAEPINRTMRGKVYGQEPVVNVVLDGETILLEEVFRPLIPAVVLEGLGLEAAAAPEAP
ncbi:MAG TPA: hypothetical protein PKK06_15710 [Phycisphaerae bacterium]|nr:hypothetical protein [Phycisphaerae bacterium]HNU46754.1 hypothetical protein [Phycisphaerae bacterium]